MRRFAWIAAIALLLIAGAVFSVWAFTPSENGGGYFSNGHDAPNTPSAKQ